MGSSRSRKRSRLFDALGVVACLSFVAVLALDQGELRAETIEIDLDLDASAARESFRPGVEWFSVYGDEGKVGYIRNERVVDGDGGFAFRTRSQLDQNPIGQGPLTFRVEAQLDDDLQLTAFEGSVNTGLLTLQAEATVVGTALTGRLEGLGPVATPFSFPLGDRPAFDQSLRPLLMQRDLKAGQRYEFEVLDPLTLQARPTVITYVGVEELDIMGAPRRAHHLSQVIAGQKLDVWVNELGEVLREQLPGGFSAIRESEAEALWGLGAELQVEDEPEPEPDEPKPVRGIPGLPKPLSDAAEN